MSRELANVRLMFGVDGVFEGQMLRQRLYFENQLPPVPSSPQAALAAALESPSDLPALRQAVVAGDRMTLVVDHDTPQPALVVAAIWSVLEGAGIRPADVTILQPASLVARQTVDYLSQLPKPVADGIQFVRHDPLDPAGAPYLASSVGGERLHLSRHLIDADLVLPIGPICPDPVLGYRGGTSVLYPGLSDAAAIKKSVGQGHQELGPDDVRPLRQLVDEVGWLLGVQYCLGLVPGPAAMFSAAILGTPDAVLREGRQIYEQHWQVTPTAKSDLVIAAVEADASGHTWEQIGRAVDAARQLVERDGRIVVLSQLNQEPGPGLKLLSNYRSAKAALKPLRTEMPPDILTATRIAKAAAWAKVYLFSARPESEVEDMFLYPVGDLGEVSRLLESDDSVSLLASAQHVEILGRIN